MDRSAISSPRRRRPEAPFNRLQSAGSRLRLTLLGTLVIEIGTDSRGTCPDYARSGRQTALRQWQYRRYRDASPWGNGYCEIFNARFRDEVLNVEIFCSLKEAQTVIEEWRKHYNTVRPHSAPGYRPPAPESVVPMDHKTTMH